MIKITNARPVPPNLEEKAKLAVDELLQAGVIRALDPGEFTEWTSPASFVPKSNGKLRLVTDFTRINKFIDRPIHLFPSAQKITRQIKPGSKVFAKLNCVHGYYQVPLAKEDQLLTTFLFPWGRFC